MRDALAKPKCMNKENCKFLKLASVSLIISTNIYLVNLTLATESRKGNGTCQTQYRLDFY